MNPFKMIIYGLMSQNLLQVSAKSECNLENNIFSKDICNSIEQDYDNCTAITDDMNYCNLISDFSSGISKDIINNFTNVPSLYISNIKFGDNDINWSNVLNSKNICENLYESPEICGAYEAIAKMYAREIIRISCSKIPDWTDSENKNGQPSDITSSDTFEELCQIISEGANLSYSEKFEFKSNMSEAIETCAKIFKSYGENDITSNEICKYSLYFMQSGGIKVLENIRNMISTELKSTIDNNNSKGKTTSLSYIVIYAILLSAAGLFTTSAVKLKSLLSQYKNMEKLQKLLGETASISEIPNIDKILKSSIKIIDMIIEILNGKKLEYPEIQTENKDNKASEEKAGGLTASRTGSPVPENPQNTSEEALDVNKNTAASLQKDLPELPGISNLPPLPAKNTASLPPLKQPLPELPGISNLPPLPIENNMPVLPPLPSISNINSGMSVLPIPSAEKDGVEGSKSSSHSANSNDNSCIEYSDNDSELSVITSRSVNSTDIAKLNAKLNALLPPMPAENNTASPSSPAENSKNSKNSGNSKTSENSESSENSSDTSSSDSNISITPLPLEQAIPVAVKINLDNLKNSISSTDDSYSTSIGNSEASINSKSVHSANTSKLNDMSLSLSSQNDTPPSLIPSVPTLNSSIALPSLPNILNNNHSIPSRRLASASAKSRLAQTTDKSLSPKLNRSKINTDELKSTSYVFSDNDSISIHSNNLDYKLSKSNSLKDLRPSSASIALTKPNIKYPALNLKPLEKDIFQKKNQ